MRTRAVVLATIVLCCAQPASAATMGTPELLSICENALKNPVPTNWQYAFCAGIAAGILQTDVSQQHQICVPDNVDTKTALQLFIDRAKSDQRSASGVATFFQALLEKYPCKKPAPPPGRK